MLQRYNLFSKVQTKTSKNKAFPNQKYRFSDIYPNQKYRFSDIYPNQNFYFAFHFQTKNTQSRCISKFHCLVTIYVWHLVSVSKYWYDDVIILGNDIAVGTNNL